MGRPPSTSRRAIELVALRLFAEQGFEATTVDDIAGQAGVSRRTFFRYFPAKNAVLFGAFADEIATIRRLLAAAPPGEPVMDAVRHAVVAANRYRPDDLPELRTRIDLLGTVPALQAAAALHYAAWEEAISQFVAGRTGLAPTDLLPLSAGRATLAVCRSAYDCWVQRADRDLPWYLDAALRALAAGFELPDPEEPPAGRPGGTG